jgi:hypothetical protein
VFKSEVEGKEDGGEKNLIESRAFYLASIVSFFGVGAKGVGQCPRLNVLKW